MNKNNKASMLELIPKKSSLLKLRQKIMNTNHQISSASCIVWDSNAACSLLAL